MTITPQTLVPIGGTPLDLPNTTNTGESLTDASKTFGEVMLDVGKSVGEGQLKLTENSANTASELAQKLVKVVAVQVTGYDDNGNVRQSEPILQEVSALTLVKPVWYAIPNLRFQAAFMVDEFVTANTTSVDASSSGFGVGLGMSLSKKAFAISAGGGYASSSSSTKLTTTSDRATAVGQMRLRARIESREVPLQPPVRVLKGPGITISAEDLSEELDDQGNVTSRSLTVLLFLRRADGTPIEDQELSIDTQGIPFEFVPDTQMKTDADGMLQILLTRSFPKAPEGAPPTDTTPKQFVISAIKGVISNFTTITM